jgi:mediator of replication checkpoint protein 1
VEDLDDAYGMDYLDDPEEQHDSIPDSQVPGEDQAENAVENDTTVNPLKRRLPDDFTASDIKENVPPKHHRRTPANPTSKRPATLLEIRESLSFLVEETLIPDSQLSASDAESDNEAAKRPMAVTRSDTSMSTESFGSNHNSVVNRLTRIRSQDDAADSRPVAFQAASASTGSMFKVPKLLRRATNLSTTSNSSSTSNSASNSTTENAVRVGGSKKSNIHYQAREAERKRIVGAAEKKRNAQVKKKVISTGRSILGLLRSHGSGFE